MARDFDPMLFDEIQGTYHATGDLNRTTYDVDFGGLAVSLIPALTTFLGVGAKKMDIDARNKATLRNIDSQTEVFRHQQNVRAQQLGDLERAASDKMSAEGLERLKMESTLSAAVGETGGTGDADVVAQASVNELHANAATIRTYEVQKSSLMQDMIADELSFANELESMVSEMQTARSVGFEVGATGMQSMFTGLNYLNVSQKQQWYNTDTSGRANV